jgi:RNA-directed DNA polymerase
LKSPPHLLATAFLAGRLENVDMTGRAQQLLSSSRHGSVLAKISERVLERFGEGTRPSPRAIQVFLETDKGLKRWLSRAKNAPFAQADASIFPSVMCPATGAPSTWNMPILPTIGKLADWLGLTLGELSWFAGIQAQRSTDSKPCHYHYEWREKRSGGVRLLEKLKEALKLHQRRVLDKIVSAIPAHAAVHSFLPSRSVRSYVEGHAGKAAVLRMNLADFFPSLTAARVRALIRTAGYPDAVARFFTGLMCLDTPSSVLSQAAKRTMHASRERLASPGLPQGAPTSAALSNVLLFRLDTHIAGIAESMGAHYTRYADDMAFSGDTLFMRQANGVDPANRGDHCGGGTASAASEDSTHASESKAAAGRPSDQSTSQHQQT